MARRAAPRRGGAGVLALLALLAAAPAPGDSLRIEAAAGGLVDLGGLANVAPQRDLPVEIRAEGAGSRIDLHSLAVFQGSASGAASLIAAADGGTVVLDPAGLLLAGPVELRLSETGVIAGGSLELGAGALLSGSGSLPGALVNGGTVGPGLGQGGVGRISVPGDYRQLPGGLIRVEIGGPAPGTGLDRVDAGGAVAVAGTLAVAPVGDYVPQVESVFTFLSGSARSGQFGAASGLDWPSGGRLVPLYGPQGCALQALGPGFGDDTDPVLKDLSLDGAPLGEGALVSRPGRVSVTATDASGIERVEFWADGALFATAHSTTDAFAADWAVGGLADGDHLLVARAYDRAGNGAELGYRLLVRLAVPGAPVIAAPGDGALVTEPSIVVSGSADAYTEVRVLVNDSVAAGPLTVGADRHFSAVVALTEGDNRIRAGAQNRVGAGPRSAPVTVSLDTGPPAAPRSPLARSQAAGLLALSWQVPAGEVPVAYRVYSATQAFAQQAQASLVAQATGLGLDYLPPADGDYWLAISALDRAGNEGPLSAPVSARSDRVPPVLEAIAYWPEGAWDPETRRMAAGRVELELGLGEALAAPPTLTLELADGTLIPAQVAATGAGIYRGSFEIPAGSWSGPATWYFRGSDWVGNQGTAISVDPRILVDTQGPSATALVLTPAAPLKNDPAEPLTVGLDLNLDEPVAEGSAPGLAYTDRAGQGPVQVQMTRDQGNPLLWHGSLALAPQAGSSAGDYLEFAFEGSDDLGNPGSGIQGPYRFEVYQGNLPPLPIPAGLAALALPGGAVRLTWEPVDGAAGYRVYRQAPGEGALSQHGGLRTGTQLEETPGADGLYRYAVASLRKLGSQTTASARGPAVSVSADSLPPGPPVGLAVQLTGPGAAATWQMPLGEVPASYRLYRDLAPIAGTTGVLPVVSAIAALAATDTRPASDAHYYAVTALDGAGNESAPSESVYLPFDLLPVAELLVRTVDGAAPELDWTPPSGDLAGFNVYVTKGGETLKVNAAPLPEPAYTDPGYDGGPTEYRVTAVDDRGAESLPRTATLPRIEATLASGLPLSRGLLGRLTWTLRNPDPARTVQIDSIALELGTQTRVASALGLAPGETQGRDLLVSGESDWADLEPYTMTLTLTPDPGTRVELVQTGHLAVQDLGLDLEIRNGELTRGSQAQASFVLRNTGAEWIELVTAAGMGGRPSPDLRFYLLDSAGTALASAPFRQISGGGVVTKANGDTVARVAPGESFASAPAALLIPFSAPDSVKLKLEIDRVAHYTPPAQAASARAAAAPLAAAQVGAQAESQPPVGEPDGPGAVAIEPRTLKDSAYRAEVTAIEPASALNNGSASVRIAGRALMRDSGAPLGLVPVRVAVANSGTLRSLQVYTGEDGTFALDYSPLPGEAGTSTVCATHPQAQDNCAQGSFYLASLSLTPARLQATAPKGGTLPVSVDFVYKGQAPLHNLTLVYSAEYQPGGQLPAGISVGAATVVPLVEPGGGGRLAFDFAPSDTAAESGEIVLAASSADDPAAVWQRFVLDYDLAAGRADLRAGVSEVQTGLHPGEGIAETVRLDNRGTQAATGLRVQLLPPAGAAEIPWIRLGTPAAPGDLPAGEGLDIAIDFAPGAQVPTASYAYRLLVSAAGAPDLELPVRATVTSAQTGNARVYVYDPFVWQAEAQGGRIEGLAGARVTLQHASVSTLLYEGTTDGLGNCDFADLPVGRYNYSISAPEHRPTSGTFLVKPGISVRKEAYLDLASVSIEWSVVPTSIQDRYDIKLAATFKTHVPAPVVTIEPASFTLPDLLVGETFDGELEVENHGLIRADKLRVWTVSGDPDHAIALLDPVPTALAAGERLTLRYRIERRSAGSGQRSAARSAAGASPSQALAAASGSGSPGTVSGCESHCFNPCPWDPSLETCTTLCAPATRLVTRSGAAEVGAVLGKIAGGGTSVSGQTQQLPSGTKICASDIRGGKRRDCRQRAPAGSEVDLLNRRYLDRRTDLAFVFRGLPLHASRSYGAGGWTFDHESERVLHRFDPQELERGVQALGGLTLNELGFLPSGTLPADRIFAEGPYGSQTCNGERNPCYQGHNVVLAAEDLTIETLGGYYRIANGARWDYFWSGLRLTTHLGYWKEYDALGRLAAYGDLNGNRVQLLWGEGESGQLAGVLDPTGRQVLWYERDGEGRIAAVRDHTGRRVGYGWQSGQLVSVTDPNGNDWTYGYDSAGRLHTKTDPEGRTFTIEYDPYGSVASVKGPDGRGRSYAWAYDETSQERLARIGEPTGATRELVFDSQGRLIRESFDEQDVRETLQGEGRVETLFADGTRVGLTFDPWGNATAATGRDGTGAKAQYSPIVASVSRQTDARGIVTQYRHDSQGRILAKTEALGTPQERTTEYRYGALGLLERIVAPGGAETQLRYDSYGRLTRRTDPLGNSETFAYNGRNEPIRWTKPGGAVVKYSYDAGGRLSAVENPLGERTTFEYDRVGNAIRFTDRNGAVTLYGYDDYNRLTSISDPLGHTERYEYDSAGNLTRILDRNGRETLFGYGADGNLSSMRDAAGNLTALVYPSAGPYCPECAGGETPKRPIEIRYPTYTERYRYDGAGRMTERTQEVDEATAYRWQYAYDPVGNLVALTQPDGSQLVYEYDALGRPATVTDELGRISRLTYDGRDNLLRIEYPGGRVSQFGYDLLNRLVSEAESGQEPARYRYDSAGNAVETVNPRGGVSVTDYDSLGRPVLNRDPLGHETSLTYGPDDRVASETDPLGNVTVYERNALGRVTRVRYPNGDSVALEYDGAGNLAARTDGAGNRWGYAWDGLGRLTGAVAPTGETLALDYAGPWLASKTDFNGKVTLYRYDPIGRPIEEVVKMGDRDSAPDSDDLVTRYGYSGYFTEWTERLDPLGRRSTRVFDALGRPVELTAPDGRRTTLTYTPNGDPQRITGLAGEVVDFVYDGHGRLLHTQDGLGAALERTYDQAGAFASVGTPNGSAATYRYDGLDRLASWQDQAGKSGVYGYDAAGRLASLTEPGGAVYGFGYDGSGELATKGTPLGRTVVYGRGATGRLESVQDENGQVIALGLDPLGRLSSIGYPGGEGEGLTLDAYGHPLARRARDGSVTAYAYDDAYRLVGIDYPGDSADATFVYDRAGRLTSAANPTSAVQFVYDDGDRLLRETQNGYTIAYSYDDTGRTRTIEYPSGEQVVETRDERGRIAAIRLDGASLVENRYDSANRLAERVLGNGIVGRFEYDPVGRPISIRWERATALKAGHDYGYDDAGNLLWDKRLKDLGHSQRLGYDADGRLVEARIGRLGADRQIQSPVSTLAYDLDGADNWLALTRDGVTESRIVDALNRYTEVGGAAQVWDGSGRLADDGLYRYEYTPMGQLGRLVRTSDGAELIRWSYDPFGRCLGKAAGGFEWAFVYDGDQIVGEYRDGTARYANVFGGGIDDPILRKAGTSVAYLLADRLGTVQALADRSGNPIEQYRYSPYGAVERFDGQWQPGGAAGLANPYLFAGKRLEQAPDLYDSRRRTYSARLGRFLQPDPTGFADSYNLYQYAWNNPLRYVDPYGEESQESLGVRFERAYRQDPSRFDLQQTAVGKTLYFLDGLKYVTERLPEQFASDYDAGLARSGRKPSIVDDIVVGAGQGGALVYGGGVQGLAELPPALYQGKVTPVDLAKGIGDYLWNAPGQIRDCWGSGIQRLLGGDVRGGFKDLTVGTIEALSLIEAGEGLGLAKVPGAAKRAAQDLSIMTKYRMRPKDFRNFVDAAERENVILMFRKGKFTAPYAQFFGEEIWNELPLVGDFLKMGPKPADAVKKTIFGFTWHDGLKYTDIDSFGTLSADNLRLLPDAEEKSLLKGVYAWGGATEPMHTGHLLQWEKFGYTKATIEAGDIVVFTPEGYGILSPEFAAEAMTAMKVDHTVNGVLKQFPKRDSQP